MKKILTISILAMVLVLMTISGVKATTSENLADTLYSLGSKYGMTSADRLKIERYLADNELSNEEANAIVAKAEDAVNVMDAAGVTDYKKLSAEDKDKVKSLANQAASIAGVQLSFKNDGIDVYKDGKLIESVTSSNSGSKLAYTGNSNIGLVVSSIAVIALVAVVARKKLANA